MDNNNVSLQEIVNKLPLSSNIKHKQEDKYDCPLPDSHSKRQCLKTVTCVHFLPRGSVQYLSNRFNRVKSNQNIIPALMKLLSSE